jgi:TetR/AcrR family transcriptional regulator
MNSYEVYEKLPTEKKQKIMLVCLEEFADKGYEGASTNDIVNKAGISKGILFHYFGNKKNLYLYVLDMTLDRVIDKFKTAYSAATTDLFERISLSGLIKLRLSLEEPLVYKLIFGTFINTPKTLADEIQNRLKKLYDMGMPMLLDGLDLSKIRGGIDPNRAIEIVLLFMEGFQAKYIETYKSMQPEQALKLIDKLSQESKAYMDILKKAVYHE